MSDPFLAFVECAGCGESFPVRNKKALNRAKWCSERCRRQTLYSKPCPGCGKPMDGSNGPHVAPRRCVACDLEHRHATAHWTRASIVAAIQRWAAEHGTPPTATRWKVKGDGWWPCASVVQDTFDGRWADAIVAAGFPRPTVGVYGRDGESMELCAEIRARYEAGESTIELGREFGCYPMAIAYRIRKAGGTLRSYSEAQEMRRRRMLDRVAA